LRAYQVYSFVTNLLKHSSCKLAIVDQIKQMVEDVKLHHFAFHHHPLLYLLKNVSFPVNRIVNLSKSPELIAINRSRLAIMGMRRNLYKTYAAAKNTAVTTSNSTSVALIH